MRKRQRNPIAMALTWCLSCPPRHPLHRAAVALIDQAFEGKRFKREVAEALGVTQVFLSTLIHSYPHIDPKGPKS